MNTQTRLVNDTEVLALTDWRDLVLHLDLVYKDWSKGDAQLIERTRIGGKEVTLSQMGGLWYSKSVAATKTYTTQSGQFAFAVTLFDLEGASIKAVFIGQALTRWRTAAQTTLVARNYFGSRPINVALFGAGLQGRAHLESLATVLNVRKFVVVDPAFDLTQALGWRRRLGFEVSHGNPQTALADADLVVTATRSTAPVFLGEWLKEDALVCAIGTSSRKGTELDAQTMSRASNIWVEDMSQSLTEAGEFFHWPSMGQERSKIQDIPLLYQANQPFGWQPGITVFKAVGNGLADTAAAWLAWHRLSASEMPGQS